MTGAGRSARDGLWRAGFLAGAVAGAAVTVAGRRLEGIARRGGFVDWTRVEAIAAASLRGAPGALGADELRAAAPAYEAAMRQVVPALEARLGSPLPGVVERVEVVDRAAWVTANTGTFAALVRRLEAELLDEVLPPGAGATGALAALANRWLATRQLGHLLGFMGRRVLGQYDLALLAAEAGPGRLLFVEENIRATAAALGVPVGPFRIWIALHETTHAWEFEAHPWLRPHLAGRLEHQLALLRTDARSLGRAARRRLGTALRGDEGGERGTSSWLEWFMGDEQRRSFRELQAVMSLLEGFGDHVMDEVGRRIVPGADRIAERFHERRERRSPGERAMLRITGLDVKLAQYRTGVRFCAAVEAAGGTAALHRVWEGPASLPTPEELEAPERWLARTGAAAVPAGGGG